MTRPLPSESAASFEPWPDGDSPITAHTSAGASPGQNGSPVTMRPAAINERLLQGATPSIRRAIVLGSATPAAADSTPVEVVALPGEPRRAAPAMGEGASGRGPAQLCGAPSTRTSRRGKTVALPKPSISIARGESEEGQAAVAQVVLNRVASGLYPPTICGVVFQNRQRWHGCQFSFACEGQIAARHRT